ncbi:MAG TPA: HAMP domain-containing sensor histidine kinase [Solirubrobacteraceae bacterium]|nr:HAMP domain-containing sensor histidine kinase [Solirubrobacteraceae bacterium]
MIPTGMRWRLTAWVAAVMLLSCAVIFVVVYRGTGRQLRQQIDHRIAAEVASLSHALSSSEDRSPHELAQAATAYVRSQPFGAPSTLQFALIPGAGTATNQPELFRTAHPDHGESASEQERENHLSEQLSAIHDGYSTLQLPDVGGLRLLKRRVRVGNLNATVGVGEPLGAVSHAQEGVARAFILAGALMLLVALIASYLVGLRVSRPLRRMAAVATRVDAGDLHPRIEDVGSRRDEVRVLADSFNHMLDRLTEAFAGQRAFVATASHELRTPLTVINGQLEVLAAQPDPPAEELRRVQGLVQSEVRRIRRLVDDLLLLANSEQAHFLRLEPTDIEGFVKELWEGMQVTAERRFELGAVPTGTLCADPDRLAQALRNLLANAVAHTVPKVGEVSLTVEQQGSGRLHFIVEDDGPGIPEDQRERVFERFHRTDMARTRTAGGSGLGLAIVRAIAEAHGGHVSAGASTLGGARVELCIPGFDADAESVLGRDHSHKTLSPDRADAEADQGGNDDRGRIISRDHVL